jgi:hypothetical protein
MMRLSHGKVKGLRSVQAPHSALNSHIFLYLL